jgi:hypothetical protein
MSNIEQYTEKTVDFKVISSYKKNVNVLNKLAYDTSSKYHEFMKFLKQYKLLKEDKQTKPNITSPTGRYLIPEGEPSYQFLNHLKVCHEDKLVLHFREMQTTNFSEDKGSGIMLDFDIYQDNDINAFDKGNVQDFSKAVMAVLCNMLEADRKIESYVGIIVKPKVVYLEDKKLYKNGFHMLIPNIWLSREQKKLFLRQLLSSKICSEEFVDVFGIGLDKALDMACASVPVYFLHNCKEDAAEPYTLKEIYKFRFRNLEGGSTDTGMDSVSKEGFEPLKEFSLSFSSSSLKKTFYKFNSKFSKTLEHYVKEKGRFEEEKEQSIAVFDHHNSYSEENLEYYRQLVLEVLNEKRAFDREMWRNAVFAVANISKPLRPALKEIAKQFSMRCESKYDTDAFESIWSDATKDDGKNKLTFNSIVYWAKEDNRAKYDSLLDKDIKTTIELDAYCSKNKVLTGALYQYHFAYYIFHLFKHKFVYDIDGKNGKWFEFVMENDSSKKGEMYKWRHEIKPDNLIIYISNRLPDIVSKVLEKADLRKQTTTEESIIKYLEARSDNLRKSAQSLYKTEFKNGVLKEAESLFRRRGFIDSLDQSENVFGVANGVLLMDDKVEFIQGFHDHPVSLYTEINYRPFDINNKSTKILLKFIISLFPEDEMDMFHYLMYSSATCLDNRPKDSMFLILQGVGSNGKSSLLELLKTVLGNYGAKVSMSILTENRSGSSGANEQLMAYVNARLAFYSETNKQEEMNCATMKEFTSQESLTGRGIFEKQKTFRPKCNHVITTNFLPIIKTTDYGTWRRLKLYTFKMSFKPEKDVDPDNKYEKVADEAVAKMFSRDEGVKEAFLSLLVEYYKHFKHFHKGKFSNILSPTLEKDSLSYRNSMDTMNKFICGNIIISKDSSVSINELVDSYIGFLTEEYGKNANVQKNEIKQIIMNSALNKFISKDNTAKTVFKGIRLLDTEDEDERLLEGEYFYNSKDNKNSQNSSDAFEYDIKNFDPLGLNEWRKNNM